MALVDPAKSTPSPKLRKFKKIPIYIVENHNDVLEFLYRCFGARYLPFQANTLIHFDAHPDMTIPRNLPSSFVFDKDRLLDTLSIENWIMPTVFAGHFSQLVWCKPHWAQQIPIGYTEFLIGEHCGFIRVNSPLEYFVSEGSYRREYDLEQKKLVGLQTIEIPEPEDQSVDVIFSGTDQHSFVLDIDLDFFSTRNPFVNIYQKANVYAQLKSIFSYHMVKKDSDENEILACARKRLEQLDALEKVFEMLNDGIELESLETPRANVVEAVWVELNALVKSVKESYPDEKIDWILIYNAGCTRDSTDLPHHESTSEEIDSMMIAFDKFLRRIDKEPTVITISRSSEDDYCPVEQVDEIQSKVLDVLNKVYGDHVTHKPILDYQQEEWTLNNL